MKISIRQLLVFTAASSFIFVVVMVAYAILNSYANLREISRYSENKTFVLMIRSLERGLGEETHLGTLVLATRNDPERQVETQEYTRQLRQTHRTNQLAYRKLYEKIGEFYLMRGQLASRSLESVDREVGEINGLYEALVKRTYDVHVETWTETMQAWINRIGSLKIDLFVPQNVHGQALKHQLITEEAVDQIYSYVLQEGQIITWLLAKNEPLTQEEVNRITYMRGFTEAAMGDLNRYIQTIDLSGESTEEWKLTLLEAYRNLELEIDHLSDVRRNIYAASLIGEPVPIGVQDWEKVLHAALKAVVHLQEEMEKPSVESLAQASEHIQRILSLAIGLGGIFVLGMVVLYTMMIRRVLVPVSIVTDRMTKIAEGNVDIDLPRPQHGDEIGMMLHALERFRDTQQQLISQSRLLRLGEEVAFIGHWQVDVRRESLYWSDQVYVIHGVTREEYTPDWNGAIAFYHTEDRETVRECFAAAIERREPFSYVCRLVRGDNGEMRFVECRARLVIDKEGRVTYVYGTFQDVTERVETERLLEAARDRAEETTRLKSEFLANMSHEIRTPMNGVIGLTNLLLEEGLTGKQRSYALGVISSAENLLQIVNDILDFSKIEAGKIELEILPFELEPLVEDVAQVALFRAQEKGLELIVDCPPDLPRWLMGDPVRLRQIIMNLLTNAAKFTHEGYIALSIRQVHEDQNEVTLAISVQDTGIGIPQERQNLLFGKFQQVDASTTRQYGGSGLGLAITRELTDLMGGRIVVESEEEVGSKFTVTIPLHRSQEHDAQAKPVQLAHVDSKNILIVDANAMSAEVIASELRFFGARVLVAKSAETGMTLLREAKQAGAPVHVALVNMQLDHGDGIQLGKQIRQDSGFKDTALILLTMNPTRGDVQAMKRSGYNGYLSKPILPMDAAYVIEYIGSPDYSANNFIDRHTLAERNGRHDARRLSDVAFNNVRVLLVEDNEVNSEITATILQRLGCAVVPVYNGRQALERVEVEDFDMILMDCQMPEMDGFQATQEIRRLETRRGKGMVPIIAFTANAFAEDRQACLAAGMTDYIPKPMKPSVLTNKMREHLPKSKWTRVRSRKQAAQHALPKLDPHAMHDVAHECRLDELILDTLRQVMQPASLRELVKSFERTTSEQLERLKEALDANDAQGAGKIAHNLKSSCRNIGCVGLADVLDEVETMAKANADAAEILPVTVPLPSMLQEYVKALKEWLKNL